MTEVDRLFRLRAHVEENLRAYCSPIRDRETLKAPSDRLFHVVPPGESRLKELCPFNVVGTTISLVFLPVTFVSVGGTFLHFTPLSITGSPVRCRRVAHGMSDISFAY